jgi:hypothetical protein
LSLGRKEAKHNVSRFGFTREKVETQGPSTPLRYARDDRAVLDDRAGIVTGTGRLLKC